MFFVQLSKKGALSVLFPIGSFFSFLTKTTETKLLCYVCCIFCRGDALPHFVTKQLPSRGQQSTVDICDASPDPPSFQSAHNQLDIYYQLSIYSTAFMCSSPLSSTNDFHVDASYLYQNFL